MIQTLGGEWCFTTKAKENSNKTACQFILGLQNQPDYTGSTKSSSQAPYLKEAKILPTKNSVVCTADVIGKKAQ